MSSLSTHVLDTSLGLPAAGVAVMLEQEQDGGWHLLSSHTTDNDGRVNQMAASLDSGTYRICFATQLYFETQNIAGLYPLVQITFCVREQVAPLSHPLAAKRERILHVQGKLTMSNILGENRYGKSRVRVMRVTRGTLQHHVDEWNVEVWLEGDFRACFEDGDNSHVLPTDHDEEYRLFLSARLLPQRRSRLLRLSLCIISSKPMFIRN